MMVKAQIQTMVRATGQRTAEADWIESTPSMAPAMVFVEQRWSAQLGCCGGVISALIDQLDRTSLAG
jgi:hypothetical protein